MMDAIQPRIHEPYSVMDMPVRQAAPQETSMLALLLALAKLKRQTDQVTRDAAAKMEASTFRSRVDQLDQARVAAERTRSASQNSADGEKWKGIVLAAGTALLAGGSCALGAATRDVSTSLLGSLARALPQGLELGTSVSNAAAMVVGSKYQTEAGNETFNADQARQIEQRFQLTADYQDRTANRTHDQWQQSNQENLYAEFIPQLMSILKATVQS